MNQLFRKIFGTIPDNPHCSPRKELWMPAEMKYAPPLPMPPRGRRIQQRLALLIHPFYPKDPHASFGKHVLTPSLALTSLAGATPGHWQVRYWDENLLQGEIPIDPIPEVVGITVHLTFAKRAYALADWFRAQGTKVILGGLHALSCPDEVAQHADALAVGDGVQTWPQILQDVENNELKPRYEAQYERPYNLDPPPRRDILPRRSFLTTSSMIATRGCHNRCGFCYLSTNGLHMPYRVRHPEDIKQQIRADAQPYSVFIDNNLGSKGDYLRELCRALRSVGVIWSAAVSLDVTDDPALVREMALAGCTGVFVGFESLTDGNLAAANKKTPKAQEYARRVALFHENGIQVNGSFVVGFDEDDRDSFVRLAEWVEENRLECATFHILTPYPGTPLFRQMEAEGRILHKDWSRYGTANVVFRPKNMTEEELAQGYDWLYRRLFSWQSIWRRRPIDHAALLPYLAMTTLYKRSNRFWHFLIKHRLVQYAWRPLVEWTRWRHLRFRKRLAASTEAEDPMPTGGRLNVVSAGV